MAVDPSGGGGARPPRDAAGPPGNDAPRGRGEGAPGGGPPAPARRAEIEELRFLVGTACSRLINLLMDASASDAAVAAEAEFLATRAARLAELLGRDPAEDGGDRPTARGGSAGPAAGGAASLS